MMNGRHWLVVLLLASTISAGCEKGRNRMDSKDAAESSAEEALSPIDRIFKSTEPFAFDFNLTDTEGKPVTKKGFEGKVLMVNVWGTWCPPCRRELPDLVATYSKYQAQGFEIVGLNTENVEGEKALKLIQAAKTKFEINYPCALTDDQTLSQIPDYGAVPTSLFFDRQGNLKARVVGAVNETILSGIVERLLQADSEKPTAKEATPPAEEK